MSSLKTSILFLTLAIAVFAGITSVYNLNNAPKIGFVRNAVIMEKYLAMKDARKEYEEQAQGYRSNLDTLRSNFQQQVNTFNANLASMSDKEKELQGRILQQQEREIQQYAQNVESKMSEEDSRLMQGVLNQINAFVKEYAEQNGYNFVFGTTIEGNIMYGGDAEDLTDEVIERLNTQYAEGK